MKYQNLKEQYLEDYNRLNRQYNLIGTIRLIVAIILFFLIYKSFKTSDTVFILSGLLVLGCFILLIKIHEKISWNRRIKKQLISINNDEITYLKGKGIPFENGEEYIDSKHFYSFDLDFFGENSLFQNLNRTATYIGSKKLSDLLLRLLDNDEIKSNQQAIKELSEKIEWRQYLLSLSKITKDNKDNYQKIIDWSETKQDETHKIFKIIFYLTPFIFITSIILYFLIKDVIFSRVAGSIFVINLAFITVWLKKIKRQIITSDKIHKIIKQYGLIIEQIENEKFDSEKLNLLKGKLIYESSSASKQIKKLSSLFHSMESIYNVMGAIILNGVFLYHIHILSNLLNWKKKYSKQIKEWLEIIGEFETLNSLANFSYNNPTFIFPDINKNYEISFKELGHPLIKKERRICNDVDFREQNFIILTGSNMSGKSTFLRTLEVNMVLAGIGAPICSIKANIHPLNVVVSMRQADSLSNGESYFLAEVKRLKQIMNKLESETCFVLLDEILKGTNSDDKQIGTIEVIKKIISRNGIGSIATHSLDVCKTTNNYPDKLVNKCFEVDIVENDLIFDYKLREGICRNKSATFLMKKLEVI